MLPGCSLSPLKGGGGQGMLLLIGEKQMSHPTSQEQKEGLGNYGLVSETGAGEVVELVVLKAVPKCLKDKKVRTAIMDLARADNT